MVSDRLTFQVVELVELVQPPHCEGSGNRRTTELVDHHEAMRALVDDFKGLALAKQQDASPELDSGQAEKPARVTVQKPCTSGYMVAT